MKKTLKETRLAKEMPQKDLALPSGKDSSSRCNVGNRASEIVG